MNQHTQRGPFLLYGPQGNAILPKGPHWIRAAFTWKGLIAREPTGACWDCLSLVVWRPLKPLGLPKFWLSQNASLPLLSVSWQLMRVISMRDKTGLGLWTCLNHWQPTKPFFFLIWKNSPQNSPKECLGTWLRKQWREMVAQAWALGPHHPHSLVLLFLAKTEICFGSDRLCGKRCKWGLEIKRK